MKNIDESRNTHLTSANVAALARVRECAAATRVQDVKRIDKLLTGATDGIDSTRLIEAVKSSAEITVNFHPDRIIADGRSVAAAMFEESTYRSQFETGISNGGLTAFPGGARDVWEKALFGGAYQAQEVDSSERPKYGGLNLMNFSDGACPRFGSCHLRLKRDAIRRATFCFGDSAAEPTSLATIDTFESILAPFLEEVRDTGNSLGHKATTSSMLDRLLEQSAAATRLRAANADHYIEAQIHGVMNLYTDVVAVVVDPSFRDTATGQLLVDGAARHGYDVEWTHGSQMTVDKIPLDAPDPGLEWVRRYHMFCGNGQATKLAQRVVDKHSNGAGVLDAAAIGQAAVSVVTNPGAWQNWAPTDFALQCLKDLWLILVVYGHEAQES